MFDKSCPAQERLHSSAKHRGLALQLTGPLAMRISYCFACAICINDVTYPAPVYRRQHDFMQIRQFRLITVTSICHLIVRVEMP